MAKIEDHKYTIEEAFRECFYVVPDYQREYVWTDKEVNQLLDDINEELESSSGREYFIGTVLVSPTAQKNHYEVIDGQQRLTTFFLLLCALRNKFADLPQAETINTLLTARYTTKSGQSKVSLKLEPKYEQAGELIHHIEQVNSDPSATRIKVGASGIKPFGSLETLLNAYQCIHDYLTVNLKNQESLERYWGYLANNVVFIQISADVSSALKIFETINERGIGLNPMDLLKNLLFTQVDPSNFGKLKDEWKKITKPLEKAKEKPLRFLRYFLMANFKIENQRGDGIVREDEIYDWFIAKENAMICNYHSKPFEFVNSIIQNVESYLNFAAGRGNDGLENIPMDNLKRLCGGSFSLHYVLLLAARNLPKDLFDHFVTQLESFLFYYIFTKTATKELERNFSLWANDLRRISGLTNKDAQKAEFNLFCDDKFAKSIKTKDNQLTDDLRRYSLNSMQQYRTRYLLAKLTQFVDMAYKGLKYPGALSEYSNLEIEHILPNNPEDDLLNSFILNNNGKEYSDYKNRLGNLTLLEKPINIVASNSFLSGKLVEYRKCKNYLTSSIAEINRVGENTSINRINQRLKSFSTWESSDIEERQEILINLSKQIWKIDKIS